MVTSPLGIICYACSLMGYWAGLFVDVDKEALVEGANTMLKIAMHLLEKMKGNKNGNLLEDEVEGDHED